LRTTAPGKDAAGPAIYAGLFFTTLGTLMYEILLTRIFSVTMWYHFAFVAVSVALFGMTLGALIVHVCPGRFPDDRTRERLAQASILFSVAIVISFVVQLQIPFDPRWDLASVLLVAATYLVIAVPFIFSGIAVCLSLTRFPRQVSSLYAVDLLGAALGTIAVIWLLDLVQDGPSAVIAIAAISAIGAWLFASAGGRRFSIGVATLAVLGLAGLATTSAITVHQDDALIRLRMVKGETESPALYETWNAFSRVTVREWPGESSSAFGWGMSPAHVSREPVQQLLLQIDSTAGTPLTRYSGRSEDIDHLRYDVTNLVHYIRPDARVFVVGSGGGRDVLTSLLFEQRSVTAVELNEDILGVVNGRYGDFTGHLDQQPGVTFVNDEARSYLARSDSRYDIIQISLIDTWAATAAGAFALSENSLYTVEAWDSFLDHLDSDGVLSVSRWYYAHRPIEAYRLISLASESLRAAGAANPRDHIIFVRSPVNGFGVGVGTVLVSKEPFSAADVATITGTTRMLEFELALAPGREGSDPMFATVAETEDLESLDFGFPADISAPTDDRPYFFQMVSFQDIFNPSLYTNVDPFLSKPVVVLLSLVVVVLVLTLVLIIVPLIVTTRRESVRSVLPFVVFFSGIGLGFLLLEVSQMQRLIIFLGHPTYALSVVLFSLLLFSGIGSMLTERMAGPAFDSGGRRGMLGPLVALLVVLVAFGFLTPVAIDHYEGATTTVRVFTAVALLAPMGLVMGMPFPLGMKVVASKPDAPAAFLWGINGATSVCASVLAVAIAVGWGISTAFWAGCVTYAVATLALGLVIVRQPK
jgi:hypothetical protein